jgi:hypothetical protein
MTEIQIDVDPEDRRGAREFLGTATLMRAAWARWRTWHPI